MVYKIMAWIVIVMMAFYFPGCSKQGKQGADKKNTQLPELGKRTADTADVFKEFYSDDTAGQGSLKKSSSKKGAKSQTFSPASAAASSAEFSENGRYVVQVSCVKSKRFAEKMAGDLQAKNYPAYTAQVENPTPALSGTFHRVRIGGFNGYGAAKSFGDNTLVPEGFEYWVDKKSNDNTGMEGYGLGGGGAQGSQGSQGAPATSTESSWSASAPGAETSSSGAAGQSDYSSSSSASMSPPPASSAPAPAPGTPAVAPAPAAPPSGTAASGSTQPSPAKESNDWGDTSSSGSGGW